MLNQAATTKFSQISQTMIGKFDNIPRNSAVGLALSKWAADRRRAEAAATGAQRGFFMAFPVCKMNCEVVMNLWKKRNAHDHGSSR
jgi:hypothetical protein